MALRKVWSTYLFLVFCVLSKSSLHVTGYLRIQCVFVLTHLKSLKCVGSCSLCLFRICFEVIVHSI